jgi:hypothetical protein
MLGHAFHAGLFFQVIEVAVFRLMTKICEDHSCVCARKLCNVFGILL